MAKYLDATGVTYLWSKIKSYIAGVSAWTKDGTDDAPGAVFGNRKSGSTVGQYSVINGYECQAYGKYPHAEGYNTVASATAAHAEGNGTTASGTAAHAEGRESMANGQHSHSEGYGTKTSGSYSHAEGRYNVDNANALHSRGVGTGDTARKNSEYTYFNVSNASDANNGNIYFLGVGGYDGMSTDITAYKSVQAVIADFEQRIAALETKLATYESSNS